MHACCGPTYFSLPTPMDILQQQQLDVNHRKQESEGVHSQVGICHRILQLGAAVAREYYGKMLISVCWENSLGQQAALLKHHSIYRG